MFNPQYFARRYLLLDRIATGGMAEVFKAKSYGVEGFEKLVVIKRILPQFSRNARFVSMFINEAKIAVSLNHGNIVQVYTLGKADEDYYIAMEYVHGRDLMQVLKAIRAKNQSLPLPLLVYIVSQVAQGLDYAHRKQDNSGNSLQIVHRDISPHNIVLSFEGEVKIVDFGIARVASQVMDENHKQRLGGKFAYMSPEQASGGHLDPRSDLFSLGLVMYELLTGQKAYQGKTLAEKLDQVRAARFPSARSLMPTLPVALEHILGRLLSASPDDRYPSASDLYEDLTGFMFSECGVVTAQALGSWLRDHFQEELERQQETSGISDLVGTLGKLEGKAPPDEPTWLQAEKAGTGTRTGIPLVRKPVPDRPHQRPPPVPGLNEDDEDVLHPDHGALPDRPTPHLPLPDARGNLKRTLVVLMAEPLGLVDMSQQMPDDHYVDILHQTIQALREGVLQFGGTPDSYQYDRFCALWGLQGIQEEDAERALSCAFHLTERIEALRKTHRIALTLSVAIHQGTALIGMHEGRLAHTALGETFKLPARMLADCVSGEIRVSSTLHNLLEAAYKMTEATRVSTTWGPRSVPTWRVTGTHSALERTRLEHERNQKRERWLPRKEEIDQLKAVLVTLQTRKGVVLGLTGEPGVGKSRFIAEVGRLVRNRNVGWQLGHCSLKDKDIPLAVFRNMLARGCRIQPRDPKEVVLEKLESLLELGLQPLDVRFFSSLFFPLADAVEAGTDLQEGLERALRRLVRRLCSDRPVILVFENVQWLDVASWKVILAFADEFQNQPVMLLLTWRQGFQAPITAHPAYRELRLEAMDQDRTAEMSRWLLNASDVPPPLIAELHQRSGGNPFYLEQLVRYLLEGGHLIVRDGAVIRQSDAVARLVPPTLQGLLESRVEALTPKARELLQMLAVAGRQAPMRLLRSLWDHSQAIEPLLSELVSRDLIVLQEGRALFRNHLTWEVAYHTMAHRDRKRLHRQIGSGLEELYKGELDSHAEELYHHFEEGGELFRAARAATRAGDRYMNEDFLQDAIGFYLKAIELLRTCSDDEEDEEIILLEMAWCYLKAGRLQLTIGDRTGAEKTLERGMAIAGDLENDALEIRFLLELGPLRAEKGDLRIARSYLEHALDLADALSQPELACAVLDTLGTFHMELNENEEAIQSFERGLTLARELDRPVLLARLLRGRGTWHFFRGNWENARADLIQAKQLVEGTQEKVLWGRIVTNLGNTYNILRMKEAATECYRQAGELYQQLGFMRGAIINTHNLGELHFRNNELGAAYRAFQESRNMAREYRWTRGEAFNLVMMGYIEAEMGAPDTGLKNLHEGLELARKTGSTDYEGIALWLEGRLRLKTDPDLGHSLLQQAIHLARRHHMRQLELDVQATLAERAGTNSPHVT